MMESKTTVSIVALVLCFSLVVKCQRDVCKTLTVSNGGHEGKWHNPQFCPPRYYATGFALKVIILFKCSLITKSFAKDRTT